MAYNTKEIVKDKDGNPISQYFNPTTNQYEPVEGSGGGNKVVLYNEDGTENNSLSLIPILDKLDQLTGTVIDEETRKANELVRISNEDTRIINEDVRIGNEIDRGDTFTTQMNRVAQIEQQVPENIVTGMANLDSDIKDLAGIGRTTQTVKGNYDDLVAHKGEKVSDSNGVHGLKVESGTWTPNIGGSTIRGIANYSTRHGFYYRIGNLVYIEANMSISSLTGGSGVLIVEGLPFASYRIYSSLFLDIAQNINSNISTIADIYNGFLTLRILNGTASVTYEDIGVKVLRFSGVYRIA